MVAILAGRRIDAEDADVARFPARMVASVKQALNESFVSHNVTALVSSAACGADLIAITVARERAMPFRIVLPYNECLFRETSVVDRPGHWGPVFDSAVAVARAHDDLVVVGSAEGDEAYIRTNEVMFDEGLRLASTSAQDGCLALVVWDDSRRGSDDVTGHFVDQAALRNVPLSTIRTI